MAYQKRNTWWGVHPDKGKKGFSNQKDAEAYEGNGKTNWEWAPNGSGIHNKRDCRFI